MNKSPCRVLPAAGLAAMQRGNRDGHCYMESSLFFSSRTCWGYINRRPCPRVRPRGHTTQRARGEIFKLSVALAASGPGPPEPRAGRRRDAGRRPLAPPRSHDHQPASLSECRVRRLVGGGLGGGRRRLPGPSGRGNAGPRLRVTGILLRLGPALPVNQPLRLDSDTQAATLQVTGDSGSESVTGGGNHLSHWHVTMTNLRPSNVAGAGHAGVPP